MSFGQRPVRARRRAAAESAEAELPGIDPLLAALYRSRGIDDAGELDYRLGRLLPVGTLPGIDAAVDLLLAHRQGRVLVIGDFDADGATSTALVLRCLRAFGFPDAAYLVPNRFDFGYGLTPQLVAVAAADAPTLIVTVDNGVSSVDGVRAAREAGIDVLVTDHHLPPTELPAAEVIVNPNLAGSRFGSPNLAGVGVAFYLMAALGRRLEGEGLAQAAKVPARFLDLVALGTVADVVRLDHNNRILVSQGLERIRAGRTLAGIAALLEVAGRSPARCVSSDLGFAVAPRLNAAGRLTDMSVGIECLLADDESTARRLAVELDEINLARRDIETTMREQAFAAVDSIDTRRLDACVSLYDERWHAGVVGLVAARIRERCHRPCIAFAVERDGELKGSARSIPGVHMRDLLEAISSRQPGLVRKFGGHAMAAGLSIATDDFDAFRRAAAQAMRERHPDADLSGAIITDGPLPGPALTLDFAETLRHAGPWGAGFPEPVFHGDFRVREQRVVGDRHLRLRVEAEDAPRPVDAIAFHQEPLPARGPVRLAYRLDVNEYRGSRTPQLIVEQISPL
ncbi:MAG: single-stranded-DNA-specific exonuclease RecJ [Woeseiaceae bacterium]|nr:single-stranded-DNA-specific exonuclease RecJ [Woeseiaceae bacterium]